MQPFHNLEFDNVWYFHFREVEDCKGITVALGSLWGTIFGGAAKCSMKDSFNKKVGRSIALGRAKMGASFAGSRYQDDLAHLAMLKAAGPPFYTALRGIAKQLAITMQEHPQGGVWNYWRPDSLTEFTGEEVKDV
jgi:hypothetical protein